MAALRTVLLAKIAVTLLCWSLPLLLAPAWVSTLVGVAADPPYLFQRLLGVAYLALCLGYGSAYREAGAGRFPAQAIWVGLVSNGGATLVLLAVLPGVWADPTARILMGASAAVTLLIAIGLAASIVRREPASGGSMPS